MSILKHFIGSMPANIKAMPDKTGENRIKRRFEVGNHENSAEGYTPGNISAKYDMMNLPVLTMNLQHLKAVWGS